MSCGCGRTSILDGMALEDLQARLAHMQQAYLDLTSGGKLQAASYSQADGARSVTYTQANLGELVQAILAVQTQIDRLQGIRCNRRKALIPYF
jgi:hypothetical protein